MFAAFGRSRELVRGNGWPCSVSLRWYLAVAIIGLGAGLVASTLGPLGRSLVQWAVNAALAPVTALSASVLYFALLPQRAESFDAP